MGAVSFMPPSSQPFRYSLFPNRELSLDIGTPRADNGDFYSRGPGTVAIQERPARSKPARRFRA